MDIRFLHPTFLLGIPAIALLWWLPRGMSDRTQVVLRSLVLLASIIALARPVVFVSSGDTYHVLVIDRSASVTAAQRRQAVVSIRRVLQQIANRDKTSAVIIGSRPKDADVDALDDEQLASTIQISDPLSRSSLSAGLAAALRQVPDGAPGVIHLFSDGLSTDRRWAPEVQQIIEQGIVVNTYDLSATDTDVYPAAIEIDGLLRVGQTARVDVTVIGAARGIQVTLRGAAGEELAISAPSESDGRITVPMTFEPPAAGFLDVVAEVSTNGPDANPANDELHRVVAVQDPIRVLYLGDRMRNGAARVRALLGRGFDLVDRSARSSSDTVDLDASDLVWLDDRPASRVPEELQRRLVTAVSRGGLGLVVSGGKAAFGAGGYDGTPIASILPVEIEQRAERRDPSTALAIIMDTSGSMAGSRIDLAKQVARLAVRRLKAHDRIGIVEFYGNKHWALPLQSAANKISIDRAIGRMQAIGGTVLMPAIEEAYYGLKNVDARYKHILIITDAGVEESDYQSMFRLIAKDGVNVSTVLVGAEAHNQIMIDMASWGRGRFYSASDRYSLPELILKQPSTQKLPPYKTGAFAVRSRGGQGWWSEIDRQSVPPIDGYVETTTRPGADVLIEVEGSSHPVLATWRYGLGSVAALMTEPVGEGTLGWRGWKDYGRLLARVVSRTADDSQLFQYEVTRDDHVVTVNAHRQSRDASLYPDAFVLDDQSRPHAPVSFRQITPDTFQARVFVDPRASLRLSAAAYSPRGPREPQQPTRLISTVLDEVSPEDQVDPSRGLDLERLASQTQGRYADAAALESGQVPAARDLARQAADASWSAFELWRWLLVAALVLYLAEIVRRRSVGARR